MKTRISMIGAVAFAAMLGVLQAPALATMPEPPAADAAAVAPAKGADYIPRVSLRDLPLFDRVLVLDEGQRAIVEALILDVEGAGSTRDALVEFRDNLGAVLSETQAARLEEEEAIALAKRPLDEILGLGQFAGKPAGDAASDTDEEHT